MLLLGFSGSGSVCVSSLCPFNGIDPSHLLALMSTVSPAQIADLRVVYGPPHKYIDCTKEAREESRSPRPTVNLIPTSGPATGDHGRLDGITRKNRNRVTGTQSWHSGC